VLSFPDFVREVFRAKLKAEYLTSSKVHAALVLCTFKDNVNRIRVEHISFDRYQRCHKESSMFSALPPHEGSVTCSDPQSGWANHRCDGVQGFFLLLADHVESTVGSAHQT
jgi:hypothetical protein